MISQVILLISYHIGNHVFTYLVKAFVLWMSWIHLCVLKMNSSECPGVFTPKASTMTSPWTNWEWGGLQHLKDSGIGHLYVYSSCTLFCNSMSGTQIFVNKTTKNHRKYLLFHLKCSYFELKHQNWSFDDSRKKKYFWTYWIFQNIFSNLKRDWFQF